MRNDSNPLSLIFSVILQSKELPSCVSTGDQALFTQRGSSIILCFALRLLVVFIENIRNPIQARNGSLPHSSLTKRRIFEYKDTNFWSKYTLFNKKARLWYVIFILCLAIRYAKRSKIEGYQ